MRAAQITRFGDWNSVVVNEVPVPQPATGEVLVRVTASSVNPVDTAHREGRLKILTGRRLPQGLGIDVVGTVETLGADVAGFAVGDRVWGIRAGGAGLRNTTGLNADYAIVDARRLGQAPMSLDDAQAAALVIGGYTALRALRDVARVRPGERVLIRGGTGGVGAAAVQIAAALGARVAVLASARNEALARQLGAQEFFDYGVTRPGAAGAAEVLVDTVGTDLLAWRRSLAPGGRMVGVAFDSAAGLGAIASSAVFGSRRIRTFAGETPAGFLIGLTRFVDTHGIRGLVHTTFPLDRAQEAHRAFATQRHPGKLIITTTPRLPSVANVTPPRY